MDPLGNVVREFLKKAHADNVRNATSLAAELRDGESMQDDQIEEMLYASGFEADVVTEAMSNLPFKKSSKKGK